jgi:hypothetical protein
MTCHRVCNWINTTGVTSGAGTAYPSEAPDAGAAGMLLHMKVKFTMGKLKLSLLS